MTLHWLIVKLSIDNISFYVMVVYLPSDVCPKKLNYFKSNYANIPDDLPKILMGHFNGNIYKINSTLNTISNNPNIILLKSTTCKKNPRGEWIEIFLLDEQSDILNGRIKGDTIGKPTYLSGRSISNWTWLL